MKRTDHSSAAPTRGQALACLFSPGNGKLNLP
jgi:hypothetical protein